MTGAPRIDGQTAAAEISFVAHADALIAVAEAAIDHGLVHGRPREVQVEAFPPTLRTERSAFVTLFDRAGELRGCVGSVEPRRPLVAEVSANAFAAAFKDPRFLPLTTSERAGLSCKLSVLTLPEPVAFTDEADLVARLRPGIDGLILESGALRGTFLPVVWAHLPDPLEFWWELKRKAGLPEDVFPADLAVYRYRADSLG